MIARRRARHLVPELGENARVNKVYARIGSALVGGVLFAIGCGGGGEGGPAGAGGAGNAGGSGTAGT
jgi:hypothetical protein